MAKKQHSFTQDVSLRINEVIVEAAAMSLREVVIFACAMLDEGLLELLSLRLVDDMTVQEELLFGNMAPLSSLSGKAKTAFLTGAITRREYDAVNRLRKIRNEYAHRVRVRHTAKA